LICVYVTARNHKKVQWQNMLNLTSSEKTIESYTNIIKTTAEKAYNNSTRNDILKTLDYNWNTE